MFTSGGYDSQCQVRFTMSNRFIRVFEKDEMVLIQKLIPRITKSLSFLCHFQVYPGSGKGFLTT